MLDRELTYRIPFECLVKLSRSASRKAFALSWFIRDAYRRLNEQARERSEIFIRPVLDASASTART